MSLLFCHINDVPSANPPISVKVMTGDDWPDFSADLPAAQRRFADSQNFKARSGQILYLPDMDGSISAIIFGVPRQKDNVMGPMALGRLSAKLPENYYQITQIPQYWREDHAAIAWGLGAYKFDTYLSKLHQPPILVLGDRQDLDSITSIVEASYLCRDLINIPANDMGPAALEQAAQELAKDYGAQFSSIIGEDLLTQNYPMIHAVGRAAHQAPRLVEFEWGDAAHPRLALIGKGITFDTGGVNMKTANGARLMKKDMGGAAHALALAKLIMHNQLPIRLHCLLAIAENSVSAGAYRPGDILDSRAGLKVEIDNTDAEGRLVLGDTLCRASESDPALMIDFATLTGAARVALGPHLPPFFSNRKEPIASLIEQCEREYDPIWPMPLWRPYFKSMLNSSIADMKNSGGGFAGAITAALFLERFVQDKPWMHFDVYGWNPSDHSAHPKGGAIYAVRGIFAWLKAGGLNGRFNA